MLKYPLWYASSVSRWKSNSRKIRSIKLWAARSDSMIKTQNHLMHKFRTGALGSRLESRQSKYRYRNRLSTHLTTRRDPSLKKLNAEREKLVKAWQAVLKKFPEKDRANLPTDLIPNIDTLSGAVDEAQQAWKSNRDGTLKERYSRFCEFADDHKYLLSIIPSGDKYVSLFTGVISSVVIVSKPPQDSSQMINRICRCPSTIRKLRIASPPPWPISVAI